MSEVKGKGRAYLKPIPVDEKFEQMDKKSMQYRSQEWKRMCILCLNQATQMLCYQMEGCTKLERYCDDCASRLLKLMDNQYVSSGI